MRPRCARPSSRWSACRSTRPSGWPRFLPTCAIGRCSSPPATDALLSRLGVALRGLDSNFEKPDAVCLLYGAASASAETLAETMATRPLSAGRAR